MEMFWYELVYRGISPVCFPRGAVAVEHNHINYKGKKYGAVAYLEPLKDDKIKSYELEPIDPLRELNDVEIYYLTNK